MKKKFFKFSALFLSLMIIVTALMPGLSAAAASPAIVITDDSGNEVTSTLEIQEYRSVQLKYTLTDAPDGSSVEWTSNLPLLADVDSSGKVTAYDYSKKAIIQQWLDQNIRVLPIVGDSTADSIMSALEGTGVDLDDMNNDLIVSIVRGIVGDTLADSLQKALDSMNVGITATLYDSSGNKLASDTVNVVVTKSVIASVAPTGVHITNKKTVPTTVAVGATVQLYGAVTPVRLGQSVKWNMGSTIFDLNSKKYASVSSSGLVTFTAVGSCTVRANPTNDVYAAFSDTISFKVVSRADLPVKDFSISGTTTVTEGNTTQLAISGLDPAGAYTGDLKWTSSDTSVAVVDSNGLVTGLDGGSGLLEYSKTCTITAKTGDITKAVTLKVTRSGITGNLSSIEIEGDSAVSSSSNTTFTSTVSPARLNTSSLVTRNWGIKNGDDIIWATSSTPASNDLASITTGGVLTPKTTGVVTIAASATCNGGTVIETKELTMGKAITDFSISGDTSVYENSKINLSLSSIVPADYDTALLSTVKWSSSNASVASVNSEGVVRGLDAGGYGPGFKKTADITATINGISKTVTVTVKGAFINYVTSAKITGSNYVVKDFPVQYTSTFTPARRDISKTLWGIEDNDGNAPWSASNTLNSSNNMSNDIATITDGGLVTAKEAGKTKIYLFGRHLLTDYAQTTKDITAIELEPESISITAPTKSDYTEGDTQLDLSGLKVKLNYNREQLEKYYPEAASLSDSDLSVEVSDYTVSEINQSIFDTEQYIVVTVMRAGKNYRGVFAITLASKAVTSIEITKPQYKYLEGATTLNLKDLTVKANYSNAASEQVKDYTVDTASFDPTLLNEEQNITVTYTHAGRSASTTFPVIVYGIPVVSVDTGEYKDGWTSKDVTFTLDSTNKLTGTTYYYKTDSGTDWTAIEGSTYTVSTNTSDTYYFKAINSAQIESKSTEGFTVNRDDIEPSFKLTPSVTSVTNQSYSVSIDSLSLGTSGVKSIVMNDEDITGKTSFTVDKNGNYKVCITANNGLSTTHTISITNIDKEAPSVTNISMEHKNEGGFARFINTITFGKFFNKEIEITIAANDVGVAGIDKVEYRYLDENGLPVNNDWQTYDENNKPTQDPNFKGFVEARAIDKAGNISDSLRSDGYVIDGDNPSDVLVNATYEGKAYTDNTWVAGSVKINVSSTAFSDIYEYRYRVDGGEWKSMTSDSVTADIEGTHIYEFKSISNSALDSNISKITVKIDRQVPVVRVAFEGTFGRWTGDNVTFDFSTLDDSISGITYYYNNGNGWIRIGTGDKIVLKDNVNAVYQFKAVNGAGTQSNPSDSYNIMIDNVIPQIKATQSVTEQTMKPYNVTLEKSAGTSGIQSVTLNGADITDKDAVEISANGNYLFTITANNGKTSNYLLTVNNFVNPVLTVTNIEFNQTSSSSVAQKIGSTVYCKEETEVTVLAQNTSDKGVSKIEYRLLDENKELSADWSVYSADEKPVLKDGFKGYVEARAYDSDNNLSENYISDLLVIDTKNPSAPTLNAQSGGKIYDGSWTGENVTFTLNSDAFSGIFNYAYRIDNGEWKDIDGSTLSVNDNGKHTFEFKAVSNSTLESETVSFTTNIDNAAPILQVGVVGTLGKATSDNIEFTLYAPNTISDVTFYCNDGNGWTALDLNKLTLSETVSADYKFKAVNAAGVESMVSPEYKVILDKDGTPSANANVNVSVKGTLGEYTSKAVTFTLVAENLTGEITYYYNDGSGFKAIEGDSLSVNKSINASYTFKAVDSLGNESAVTQSYIVMIDKSAPTLELSAKSGEEEYQSGTKTEKTVDITLNAAADSGIDKYYYSLDGAEWTALESNTLKISAAGEFTYRFKAVSNTGAESAVSEVKTNIVSDKNVIKGSVSHAGSVVTLMKDGTEVKRITTDDAFAFYVDDGTYSVVITKPAYTDLTVTDIVMTGTESVDLTNLITDNTPSLGDVNMDGIINVNDISLVLLTANYSRAATVLEYKN